METSKRYNLVLVKHNCALFAPTPIFGSGLSDNVVKIFLLPIPVAMATNFGTKFDYNAAFVKNSCMLFSPTPLFSGPGYLMVSFKFLHSRPPLLWQQILGEN